MTIQAQLADGRVLEFPDGTDPSVIQATVKRVIANPLAAQSTEQLESAKSAPMSIGDTLKSLGSGVVGGGKSLVDFFGTGTDISKGLGEAQSYLQESLSPERQAEIARRQELQDRAARSGSLFQEAKAFIGGVTEAPIQAIAQALGSSAPAIITGIAALPASAPAALALGVGTIAKLSVGAMQGVGEMKGGVFDAVKAEYMKQGKTEKEAEELAIKSSEYSRDMAFQTGGAALLGALDAVTGAEPGIAKAMRKASPTGAMTKEAIDAGIGALPQKAVKAPSYLGQLAKGVATESPLEGAQGAFGQYGENVALQPTGADVTPMQGVLGAGLRDATVGALFGGAASPLGMRSARQEYATDQFLRQAKEDIELDKRAAESEKIKSQAREGLGATGKQLLLPAPSKAYEEPKDPLQDPVGRITEAELGKVKFPENIGSDEVVKYLKAYRKRENLPPLKSYSLEDIKDAMTAQNPAGEEGALNSILAYKTNYQNETYTPKDIENIVVAKNIATGTKGFSDFLTRATGKSDLNTMTQPELHSVAKALNALERTGTEEQLVLPEGSNATRFTQDQYNGGVTAALLNTSKDKPVTYDEALKRVQTQKGVDSDQAADRLLKAAAANDDLVIEKGTGFQALSKAGTVLGTYATEAEAKRNHRRADINPVETQLVRSRDEEKTEKVSQLPEGYGIEKTAEVGEERPAAYVLRTEGSQKNASQTFAEESDVKNHLELLTRKREATAAAKDDEADRIRKQLEKKQASIAQMEADGLTGTPEHTKAVNAFKASAITEGFRIEKLVEEAQVLREPLKVVPLGKKSTKVEKHTVIKGGKKLGTFPNKTEAEKSILSQATDAELQTIADRGGAFGKRAEVELGERKRTTPGVKVRGTKEGLEAAGVHTQQVEAQLQELKAKLLPMLKKFGLEEVGLNVVRAIENDADGAWGKADKLIRIALQATKPIQTMRHEALHALKELGFFTPQQWEALKRQADKTWVNKYLKGQMVEVNGKTMTRYDAYANGVKDENGEWVLKPLSPEDILEEAIADAFGDWEGGAKPPPGMMAALFKRMQQFFAALRQALTGAGFESAEDIFGKIERGELKAGKQSKKETSEDQKFSARAAAYWMDAGKVVRGVTNEMDLTEEEFESTSLMHQTGKAGTEQFKPNKIGGLPEVVQFLQDQRRKSGLPLLDTEKPADRKIIARLMATEALAAIRSGGANLEWYDSVINKTLAMAGLKYPELNTDINARMAFRIATAITSQGLNVEDNLAFAMKVYDQFRQSGKFPEIGQGADQNAMASNFKLANYLMDDMGADLMRQFLETEFTVEEMRGAGFNIAGELGDEKVLGSSVFGPKIGFGFYSNLNGNFDPVTMDMWFMRTIGRLTGKLKSFRQDLYDAQLEKFRNELDTEGSNGVFANQFDQNEVELAKVDDKAAEALARKVKSAHERDYKVNRASFDDGTREKSKLVAVSETMIKSLDAPKDAPANGSERRNLRDIVRQMVDIIEEKYGKRVPPASLQAVIWYPEQELYKSMGVKLRVTSQNYAGAIEKILTGEGYGESNLSAAAKLGSRTAQQLAKSAVAKGSKATGAQPVRLGALQAEEKEALLERGRKRVVLEEEKETPKRKRVIFEVAPDPNNKALTDKWRSLPNEVRIKISEKIGNTIIKSALTELGLKGYVDTQVGSYLDDTNPSFALYLDSGDSVAMAKFLGYTLSQDSMMVVSPKAGKGLDKTGAVRINIGDAPASKVDKIYQQLREIEVDGEKPVGGQSYMNGHMVVLNYSNVPTDQLAKLINDKLNDDYEVITEDVYTAFPEKKDYDYADPSSDPRGNAGVLRQASRDLRTEATRLLQKELKEFKPKAPAKDQKLSLRQVRDIFDRAEEISEPPGVEAIREQWIGGVSGVGDRDSMYDLYRVNGSKKYIQDVQDFIRKELGDDFKGYRLMSNDELEELETGSMGSQFVSVTLSPEVAKAFKNIPAYANKTGMSVVEMDLTPEHVAMIGHPGELELVVDYGQGYNPSDIKVVEKYSLRAAPDTKEFKQWFGNSKVVDENGNPLVVYRGVVGLEKNGIAEGALNAEARKGYAAFGSSSPYVASSYANPEAVFEETGAVTPLYIKADKLIEFPVTVDKYGSRRFDYFKMDRLAQTLPAGTVLVARQVVDIGPRAKNSVDPEKLYSYGSDVYAWNKGTSVKSAIGNKGAYDVENPDIRYSLKTYFPTAEAAEKAAYKKAPPGTAEFKRFFGGSKVMEEGRAQPMFHASMEDFNIFRENRPIFVSPDASFAEEFIKRRIRESGSLSYLSEGQVKKKTAKIYPLWVRAETPFDYDNDEHIQQIVGYLQANNQAAGNRIAMGGGLGLVKAEDLAQDLSSGRWTVVENSKTQEALKALGFDSFYTLEGGAKNLAVFKANQLKSITGNLGSFDESGDIRYSLKNSAIHSGNLRYGRDTTLGRIDGSRNTGHFGTGVYFVSNIEKLGLDNRFSGRTDRPVHQVDLSPYKLAKPLGNYYAERLHDGLRIVNRMVGAEYESREEMTADLDKAAEMIKNGLDLKESDPEIKKIILSAVKTAKRNKTDEVIYTDKYLDSASTMVIKGLGFDGIDVRRLDEFDNTKYGTVVYRESLPAADAAPQKYSLKPVSADIDAAIDRTTTAREEQGFIGRILEAIFPKSASHFRQQALNRYNQLGVYDKMLAEKMGGAAMLADASAESAALMSDLSASVTASAFGYGNRTGGVPVYKNGMTTIDTSVKGPIAILAPLAKYNNPRIYQRYQFWAGVKRAERLFAEGKEKNFEQTDVARAAQLEKEHPEFVQIQKEMNEFNNGLVKYMVQTGVLKPELAKVYMEHADYIPFYRQMDGERTVGPNIFQSMSGVKPPKALKGGEAPLTDYLETIVRNTQSAINSGMKNIAAQRAVGVAEKIGMAQRLKEQDSAPDTVQVLENGVRVSYRVADPLFIDACRSLNLPDLPFMGLLAAPANFLRNFVTKDPGFMLANMMRDSLSSWVTSGANVTPIIGTMSGFTKALSGKSASMEALLNAGILGGYEFSSGVLKSGEVLAKDMNKKYGKATGAKVLLKPFTSLWDALEKGTEASDAATRIAIYERVLADTGNEAEAIFRSLEVMNFNRKGSSAIIRIATAAIPFLNARMQGLDIFYRTAFGRDTDANAALKQKAFFVRGATLMAISVALFTMVSDDEEYKKQEEETKDNYWIIPGVGKFPIPFEVGFLFKTVPERIFAYAFKDDTGEDLKESMKRGITSTLAFNPMPQTFKPIAEALVNYNSFTGRVIVGAGMEGRAPEFQVGPSTSEVAKQLGSALGLSPLKVDHVLQGYTGTIGMYLVQVTDSVLTANDNSPNASKRFEQLPIIKRFAVDPEARGNITQFYALKNATDQAVTTLNFLERSGDAEAYAKYFEDNAGILANKNYVQSIEKQMKKYREMRAMVQSAEMTGDEKRDLLIDIGRAENALNENIKEVKKIIKEVQ